MSSPDSSPETPEAVLIERAVAGDREALEDLLVSYHGRLRTYLQRRIPPELASVLSEDDVLQETYLSVAQQIGQFRPREPDGFARWLHRVAKHRLVDLVRRQRAVKRGGGRVAVDGGNAGQTSCVLWLELLAVHERTPSRSAAEYEVAMAVQRALKTLKPEHGEVLRLRYIEGRGVADIAEIMQRSEGAVHMLCQRALRRLEEALGFPSSPQSFGG
jgi:RNA polymerase sigma-70 factor (ECF subfamily)